MNFDPTVKWEGIGCLLIALIVIFVMVLSIIFGLKG
jgi:hypothetical protein